MDRYCSQETDEADMLLSDIDAVVGQTDVDVESVESLAGGDGHQEDVVEVDNAPVKSEYDNTQREQEDEELQILGAQVDEFAFILRKSVMEAGVNLKFRLLENHAKEVDIVTNEYEKRLMNSEKRAEEISQNLAFHSSALRETTKTLDEISKKLLRQKEFRNSLPLLISAFRAWHWYIVVKRKRKVYQRVYESRLCRNVFSSWRNWAYTESKRRNEEMWKNRMDIAASQLMSEYEVKLSDLTRELNKAKESLNEQETHKQRLEGNLKKAFMRGVCALNMEAMTILREGKIGPKELLTEEDMEEAQDSEKEFPRSVPPVPEPKKQPKPARAATAEKPTVSNYRVVRHSRK